MLPICQGRHSLSYKDTVFIFFTGYVHTHEERYNVYIITFEKILKTYIKKTFYFAPYTVVCIQGVVDAVIKLLLVANLFISNPQNTINVLFKGDACGEN